MEVTSIIEGTLEEIVAAVPEGGAYSLYPETPTESEQAVSPVENAIIKIAVYNVKGYPINVLYGTHDTVGLIIQGLPPGNSAVTISGTKYDRVEMAGELPPLDELRVALDTASKE